MVAAEFAVIVDVRIDGDVGRVALGLVEHRGGPVGIGPLLEEFGDLVIGPVVPVLLPVLVERAHQVVGEVAVHRQALGDETEVPVRREGGVQGVDGGLVVTGEVLHQDRRVRAALEQPALEALVLARALREIGGAGGTHPHRDVEDAVGVGREGRVVLVLLAGVDVHAQLEALGDLDVQVRTEVELVVVRRTLIVDAVLVLTVELHEVRRPPRTAVDAHPVLVLGGDGLDDLAEPVGVRIGDGVVLVAVVLDLGVVVDGSAAGDRQAGVVRRGIEDGVGQLDHARRLLEAQVVGEAHLGRLVVLAALGRHQDDAVRGTGAVDGGRGVLQDVDAFDFVAGEAAEFVAAALDTVDDDQRAVVAEGGAAADEHHRVVASRLAGTVVHDDARHTAGKALGQVHGGVFHEFFARGGGHGARQGHLALVAVADGHGLVQDFMVVPEGEVDGGASVHGDGLLLIAHHTGDEGGFRGNAAEAVASVGGGHRAVGRPLDIDHRSRHGFSLGVGDDALHPKVLGPARKAREAEQQARRKKHQNSFGSHHNEEFVIFVSKLIN